MPLVLAPGPSIQDLNKATREGSTGDLLITLSTVFESSDILRDELVPTLGQRIQSSDEEHLPKSYDELIDAALEIVHGWPREKQATFVGGHPRIGEVKALSALSASEQGQAGIAPIQTQDLHNRLEGLNSAYEQLYPGLVYITFVNGRSRAQIAVEMEEKLKAEQISIDECAVVDAPKSHSIESEEWGREVTRAVEDVGRIAKSRLKALGLTQAPSG